MLVAFNERATPTWKVCSAFGTLKAFDNEKLVSKIPFPAMTICTESKTDRNKFNLSRAIEMTDDNLTLPIEDAKALEALIQICDLKLPIDEVNVTKQNIIQKLFDINHNFLNLSETAQVGVTNFAPMNSFFQEIVTGEGICYTTNMLDYRDLYTKEIVRSLRHPKHKDRSNWTVAGYESNDPNLYPGRILGSGRQAGMTLKLVMSRKDVDYACKGAVNGFRLTLHTPDEMPQTAAHFYRIPFHAETLIAITPRGISTSEDLRNYKPKKRQCFFPGEKQLRFFKSYTQANCKLECLSGGWDRWTAKSLFSIYDSFECFQAYVLKRCKCVKFSMPHMNGTRVCSHKQSECIEDSVTYWYLNVRQFDS